MRRLLKLLVVLNINSSIFLYVVFAYYSDKQKEEHLLTSSKKIKIAVNKAVVFDFHSFNVSTIIKIKVKNSAIVKVNFSLKEIEIIGLKIGTTDLLMIDKNGKQIIIEVTVFDINSDYDVLAISNGIIATTKGVFNYKGNWIVCETLSNLKKSDILAISNSMIATTAGVFDYEGRSIRPDILTNLTKDDIIAISSDFIFTSKGVFTKNGQKFSVATLKGFSSKPLADFNIAKFKNCSNNVLKNLTRGDVFAVSDQIIATIFGIFDIDGNLILDCYEWFEDDIIAISSDFIFTTRGVFDSKSQRVEAEILTGLTKLGKKAKASLEQVVDLSQFINTDFYDLFNSSIDFSYYEKKRNFRILFEEISELEIIAKYDNFVVTTEGIFNNNYEQIAAEVLNNPKKEDILAVSGQIIATTKGIFNHKGKQIGEGILENLTKEGILAMSGQIIATTLGIFNKFGQQIGENILDYPISDDILAISNYLIATSKGVFNLYGFFVVEDNLKNLVQEDVKAISDFIIATSIGVFNYFGNKIF